MYIKGGQAGGSWVGVGGGWAAESRLYLPIGSFGVATGIYEFKKC